MKLVFPLCVSLFFCTNSFSEGSPPDGSSAAQDRVLKLHEMAPEQFQELQSAGKPIDFEHIDHALLDAAVFQETNIRRANNGLSSLAFRAVLREAARIQARGMIRLGEISHQHPDADKKTVSDRFDFLGIETRLLAENVAKTFGIRYKSGEKVYKRKKDGRAIFSVEPNGEPIRAHTYSSFASHLLDEWMASTGHRKNILTPGMVCLGVSSLHDRSGWGMDSFYSVQEFSGEIGD